MLVNSIFKRCQTFFGKRLCSYIQGQSPESRVREYFYYIDHHGQLFLDDARMKNFTSCFKDKTFLVFFFTQLRRNDTGRYSSSFPYISFCGRERNFLRCDDFPTVYTQVLKTTHNVEHFVYCNGGESLSIPFDPSNVCMLPSNGRIYYPASDHLHGIGLIRSGLAIEFSRLFQFANGPDESPTHIVWNDAEFKLNNHLLSLLENRPSQ